MNTGDCVSWGNLEAEIAAPIFTIISVKSLHGYSAEVNCGVVELDCELDLIHNAAGYILAFIDGHYELDSQNTATKGGLAQCAIY